MSEYVHEFFRCHSNRQGIAVLGFSTDNAKAIHDRYETYYPHLVHSYGEYMEKDGSCTKVLQVFAYNMEKNVEGKRQADSGTLLRFVENNRGSTVSSDPLPGLTKIRANFDSMCQAAYCDHWVSNVYSRTDFWETLETSLGFTPKVCSIL